MDSILTNLPHIIFLWTALTFSWSIVVEMILAKLINDTCLRRGIRITDAYTFALILVSCVIQGLFLIHEPITTKILGDSVIVLNIFNNSFLLCVSISLVQWWESLTPVAP